MAALAGGQGQGGGHGQQTGTTGATGVSGATGPTYKRVRVRRWVRVFGRRYSRRLTGYGPAPCDGSGGGSTTSMGTHVHFGEVAVLPGDPLYGKHIWMRRAIHGRHEFAVQDHIGSGSTLDVFLPCSWLSGWSNPTVTFWTVRWARRTSWRMVPATP